MATESASSTTGANTQGQEGRNRATMAYMLLAVVGFSSMPLIVSLSDIEFSQDFDASSAYGASIAFGASIACFACLLFIFCQRVIFNSNKEVQEVRAPIRWRISNLLISCRRFIFNRQVIMLAGFVLLANYGFVSFVSMLEYGMDISVAAILLGSMPIIWRLLAARLWNRIISWQRFFAIRLESNEEQKRSKNIFEILMDWTRISVLFVGLCFVVESQSTALLVEFVELSSDDPIYDLVIGGPLKGLWIAFVLTLFIFTNAVIALMIVPVFWRIKRLNELGAGAISGSAAPQPLPHMLIALLIGNLISAGVFNALAGEPIASPETHRYGIVLGIVITTSFVFWQKAHLTALTSIGLYELRFAFLNWLMPIIAFSLLLVFGVMDVRLDYIVIGAAALIITNLLTNFESGIRSLGGRATVAALWFCGVIVYIRDDLFEFLNITGWVWIGSSYFDLLALSALVFTLLLAFRIGRIEGRTTDEDNRTFALFQKLDRLIQRGVISADIRRHIQKIDVSEQRTEELERAYNEAMTLIYQANAKCEEDEDDDKDKEELGEAVGELHMLVHSKTKDALEGEIFALGGVAFIIVCIALFSRPENISGLSGFLLEAFAILFSSIVIFLAFNLQDLHSKRIEPIMEDAPHPASAFTRIKFDSQPSIIEFIGKNLVPIIIPIIVFFGWMFLLLTKWFDN